MQLSNDKKTNFMPTVVGASAFSERLIPHSQEKLFFAQFKIFFVSRAMFAFSLRVYGRAK